MSTHTPGPWSVFANDFPGDYPGIEANDWTIVIFGDAERIDDDSGVRGRTDAEILANARLIAAAPDMLAAAKALFEYAGVDEQLASDANGSFAWGFRFNDLRALQAAISRAEGRAA